MKRLLLITFAFNLLFLVNASSTNKDGETRSATVKVSVTANDLINIKAKYTDLVVEAWDKDEVEVVATVRFDGKMTDKMVEFLDNFQEYVEENITKSGGELEINTNLDEPNKIQIGSKRVGIIVGFSEDELRLDYKIKTPRKNKYEINSSYRDLRLIGSFENMEITQYSGELNADFIGKAELNLKYGSASFKEIKTATMEIYEQEIEAETIGTLEITTKYSELEIRTIDRMEAASYESDFEFDNAGFISGNFKYGEIAIQEELGDAKLEFYEMEIEARSIKNILLTNSKYSKVTAAKIGNITYTQSYEDETSVGILGSFKSLDSKYGEHEIEKLTKSLNLDAYEDDINIEEVSSSVESITIKGKYINSKLGLREQSYNLKTNVKYGKVDYNESEVNVKKYIKEDDKLEVEVVSKNNSANPIQITAEGYEIDVEIN